MPMNVQWTLSFTSAFNTMRGTREGAVTVHPGATRDMVRDAAVKAVADQCFNGDTDAFTVTAFDCTDVP